MDRQFNKSYIIILSVVSISILVAGVWLRPALTPAPVSSAMDVLSVQLSRQRIELERRSFFFATRAADLMTLAADVRVNPERVPFRAAAPGETVILVGTDPGGQRVWASSQTAGIAENSCRGVPVREIAVTIRIPATLATGVAFDFDNNLAGFVVSCEDRPLLVELDSFQALKAESRLELDLQECCGISTTPKMQVTAVDAGSDLAKSGLREGDSILAVAGEPVSTRRKLHGALTASPPPNKIIIRRTDVIRELRIRRAEPPK